MKLKSLGLAFLILTTLMFSGCTIKPIYNVSNTPITTSNGAPTDSQIVKAIIRAGSSLGWSMQKEAPGHIIGTLNIRKHIAIVDITYNSDSYSIIYKDSTNLKYDGTKIHRNYNNWVHNLNNAIRVQLKNKVQLNKL
jgi:hypothetical protein